MGGSGNPWIERDQRLQPSGHGLLYIKPIILTIKLKEKFHMKAQKVDFDRAAHGECSRRQN